MTSALPSWVNPGGKPFQGQPLGAQPGLQAPFSMTKTKTGPGPKIDKLMELASRALTETHYFECERACMEALEQAHLARDYERMARILLPLQEARRQIRLQAIDTGKLTVLNKPLAEGWVPKSGCYLIEPPLVGADAREVRDRAAREEIPVAVIAREPVTRTKKLDARGAFHAWPLVMIGPITQRCYIRPPKGDKATMPWFLEASELLGDTAISSVDVGEDVFARVDDLFNRLHTVTDHEKLHQALEHACREATVEAAKPAPARKNQPKKLDELDEDEEDVEAEL